MANISTSWTGLLAIERKQECYGQKNRVQQVILRLKVEYDAVFWCSLSHD